MTKTNKKCFSKLYTFETLFHFIYTNVVLFLNCCLILWGAEGRHNELVYLMLIQFVMHNVVNYISDIYFHNTTRGAMIANLIRNIVMAIDAALVQHLSGKAAVWLIHLFSVMALGMAYNVYEQPVWVSFLSVFKILQCVITMYIVGSFSFYETVCITHALTVCALVVNFTSFVLRRNQMELQQANEKMIDQNELYNSVLSAIPDILMRVNRSLVVEFMKNEFFGTPSDFVGKSIFQVIQDKQSRLVTLKKLNEVFETGNFRSWIWKRCTRDNEIRYFRARASAIIKSGEAIAVIILSTDITEQRLSEQRKLEAERADIKLKAKTEFISSISHEIRNPLQSIIYAVDLLVSSNVYKVHKDIVDIIKESARMLSSIIGDVLDFQKIESGKIAINDRPFSILSTIETTAEVFSTMANSKMLQVITFVDPALPLQCIGDCTRIIQIINNFLSNALKFTNKGHIFLSARLESITDQHVTVRFECQDTGIGISKVNQRKLFRQFIQVHEKVEYPTFHQGWGLGLSISKKLVHLMQGKIGVQSELGKGSTFWFSLKLKRIHGTPSIMSLSKGSKYKSAKLDISNPVQYECLAKYLRALHIPVIESTQCTKDCVLITDKEFTYEREICKFARVIVIQPTLTCEKRNAIHLKQPVKFFDLMQILNGNTHKSLKPEKSTPVSLIDKDISVLLVEDHPVIQKLTYKLLTKAGIKKITIASNGLEAVNLIAQGAEFNIILMDIQMPVLNGFEASKQIRLLERGKNVPIIAVSANVNKESKERCIRCGMQEVLLKPISMECLIKAIQRFV